MKKLLIIINPAAGTRQGAKYLADISDVFCRAGYETVIATTAARGDGTEIARTRGPEADIVVAIGGDGTFNEVVAGLLQAEAQVPVGYIPAGTTNDFATSLGLSKDLVQAAVDVVQGKDYAIDIGSFNGRYFSYVASFGAFSNTSYEVPQNLKNVFGHMAYILGGAKDLLSLRPVKVRLENEVGIYGGNYIFGAVCNSTSMGGVLTLDHDMVDMSDGKFEVLLIRMPRNLIELQQIVVALTTQRYRECPMMSFFSSSKLLVEADPGMNWTLDGEFQEGAGRIEIFNHRQAVTILVPENALVALEERSE